MMKNYNSLVSAKEIRWEGWITGKRGLYQVLYIMAWSKIGLDVFDICRLRKFLGGNFYLNCFFAWIISNSCEIQTRNVNFFETSIAHLTISALITFKTQRFDWIIIVSSDMNRSSLLRIKRVSFSFLLLFAYVATVRFCISRLRITLPGISQFNLLLTMTLNLLNHNFLPRTHYLFVFFINAYHVKFV